MSLELIRSQRSRVIWCKGSASESEVLTPADSEEPSWQVMDHGTGPGPRRHHDVLEKREAPLEFMHGLLTYSSYLRGRPSVSYHSPSCAISKSGMVKMDYTQNLRTRLGTREHHRSAPPSPFGGNSHLFYVLFPQRCAGVGVAVAVSVATMTQNRMYQKS